MFARLWSSINISKYDTSLRGTCEHTHMKAEEVPVQLVLSCRLKIERWHCHSDPNWYGHVSRREGHLPGLVRVFHVRVSLPP